MSKVIQDGLTSVPSGVEFTNIINYRYASQTQNGTNVVIEDNLDPDLSWTAAQVIMGSSTHIASVNFNSGTGKATWTFVNPLPAGSSGQLTLRVRFKAGTVADGTVATNSVRMSASNADSVDSDAVSISATASYKQTALKTWTSGGTPDNTTTYRIEIKNPTGGDVGGLAATNVTLVDPLPLGAVYVSSTGGGVYDSVNHRVVWTNVTASVGSNNSAFNQTVSIRYPTPLYDVGNEVCNSMTATGTAVGGAPVNLAHSLCHNLIGATPAVTGFAKTSTDTTPEVGQNFDYRIAFSNTGSVAVDNFVVEDPVPSFVDVTQVRAIVIPGNTTRVYYQRSDAPGSWVEFDGSPATTATNINAPTLPGGVWITSLRWELGAVPQGYVAPTSTSALRFAATVRSTDRSGNAIQVGNLFTNCARMAFNYSSTNYAGTNCVTSTVVGIFANPEARKTMSGTYVPGGEIPVTLTVRNRSGCTDGLVNPVLADLLPTQLEYVAGSSVPSGLASPVSSEPEILPDYNSSGRTLLRWTYNATLPPGTNSANKDANIAFKLRVKPGTAVGTYSNTNYAYVVRWDNTGSVTIQSSVTDTRDLDGDGSTTDLIARSSATSFSVGSSASLDSFKQVKGQLDSDWSRYPDSGRTSPGGTADYRLVVMNPGNVTLTNISIVDILPALNDTGVVDLSPRLSEWTPFLAAPVTAPPGVTVYYSTSPNPQRDDMGDPDPFPAGASSPDWSAIPPADITTVRSLRFDFGTRTIAPLDQFELTWPMRVPVDAPTNEEIAWNSFGVVARRVDNGLLLLPTEPIKVGISVEPIKPAAYGNLVWLDSDRDGIQDAGEPGLDGVRVEIYRDNGDGISNPDTDEFMGFTLSSGGGQYLSSFLPEGNYYGVFFRPPTYLATDADVGADGEADSDGIAGTVRGQPAMIAPVTHLDSVEIDLAWDQGFYLPVVPVAAVGNFVWYDRNANGTQDEAAADGLNGVTVRLYTGADVLVSTTTTANDVNGNPGYYLFDGLTPGSYRLEFVLPNGFTYTTQGSGGTSDPGDSDADASTGLTEVFTLAANAFDASWDAGLRLPTGNLSLGDRVWFDSNGNGVYEPAGGETGVDGVTLNLYRDLDADGVLNVASDQFFATTTSFTRNAAPGFYAFENLPAGAFLVQVTPANFVSGSPLAGSVSTSGNGIAPDPDNNTDHDDQGEPETGLGVVSRAVTLSTGAEPGAGGNDNPTLDFGFVRPAALGNQVWNDADNDGQYEPEAGEDGINEVTVELYYDANHDGDFLDAGEGTPWASTQTSGASGTNGLYSFTGLHPGHYYVRIPSPPASAPLSSSTTDTADNAQDDDDNGSQADVGLPVTSPTVLLVMDETDATVDFGLLAGLDFGDLPDASAGSGAGNYQTRVADGGPYHHLYPGQGFRLGGAIDGEGGMLQNAGASADDATDTGAPDDEDGVSMPSGVLLTTTTQLLGFHLGANAPGFTPYLNVWIDFNGDGDFEDTVDGRSERFRANAVMNPSGVTQALMEIPASAHTGSPVGLRVRLSSAPLTSPNGDGGYGEVEDYLVSFAPYGGPTLALISQLRASSSGGRTWVDWETAHEAGSVAFRLLRLDPSTSAWLEVSPDPVPALRSPFGGSYRVADPGVSPGQVVNYQVAELDDAGIETLYGPFTTPVEIASSGNGTTSGAGAVAFSGIRGIAIGAPAAVSSGTSIPSGAAAGLGTQLGIAPNPGSSVGSSSVAPSLAAQIKIPTRREGVHFVALRDLVNVTGRTESQWKDFLSRQVVGLTVDGQPVPLLVAEGGTGIFFFAEAPDSIESADRVYWLSGLTNTLPRRVDGTPQVGEGQGMHRARGVAEEDLEAVTTLGSDPTQDYWMWKALLAGAGAGAETVVPVTVPDLEPGALDGTARWTVELRGGDVASRRVVAWLENGRGSTELGSVTWSGKEPARLEVDLNAALFEESGNRLRLRAERQPGAKPSLAFLDRHLLTYPARLAAHGGQAWLHASTDETYAIPGFGSPDVAILDVTEPRRPEVITGVSVRAAGQGAYTATFAARAGRRYLAFEPSGVTVASGVTAAVRPSLRLTRNRAEYLVITPPGLLDAARELADHRKAQGMSALVVTTTSIADEFGAGVPTSRAIREFVGVAARTWALPPRYVLLFGDGTYDYRDLTGAHDNLVPPTLLPTGWGLYASDALVGDVDGDGRIEVSVGRLPVTSSAQGRQMLAKIRAFEGAAPSGRRRALLLADQPDAAGDFTAGAESLRGLLAPGFDVSTVYRSELGSAPAVRSRLRQGLAGDLDYLSYSGHGAHDRFGVSGYLLSSEVASLGNSGLRLPVVSAMTCAVGNFAVPGNDPLAETLVLAPDRGAIAVWSPSGLSLDSKAQALARRFAQLMAGAVPGTRLGDLLRDSMNTYRSGAGDLETLVIYNLLGDPALRIRN